MGYLIIFLPFNCHCFHILWQQVGKTQKQNAEQRSCLQKEYKDYTRGKPAYQHFFTVGNKIVRR